MQAPALQKEFIIGVDIGGTKVAVIVVNNNYSILTIYQAPTNLTSPASIVDGVIDAITTALERADISFKQVTGIGIGVPGFVDPVTGFVNLAVNLNLVDYPLGPRIQEHLNIPCFLNNDVRAAALGVMRLPENHLVKNLAYISVGTGIAAGLVLNGELFQGTHGLAGEIGHIVVELGGSLCPCGQRGCLETVASGPAIANRAKVLVSSGVESALVREPELTSEAVYRWAAQGDAVAGRLARETGVYLAQAVYNLVLSTDVEKIVFGGGVSRAGKPFLDPVLAYIDKLRAESSLARQILNPAMVTNLSSDFPAGLWGAVALAQQNN